MLFKCDFGCGTAVCTNSVEWPIYECFMWLHVAITFPNDHLVSTCRSNITDREKWPTDGHQASGEFDGSWQVTHLIDWVTKIIQNISFGRLGVFSGVHLSERLLHPQHWMIIVILIVGQFPHVKAVVHCQLSLVANPCRQNVTSFITGFSMDIILDQALL